MTRGRVHASAAIPEPTSVRLVSSVALTPAERQRETAEYLAEMILELRNLARSVKLHTVMVPLEYAYYEAFTVANRVEVPEDEIERIRRLSKASGEPQE
jgi:hypothetical protein